MKQKKSEEKKKETEVEDDGVGGDRNKNLIHLMVKTETTAHFDAIT